MEQTVPVWMVSAEIIRFMTQSPGILGGRTLQFGHEGLPDVLGLRARQPEGAVVKVMSIPNNRCIQVLILENVGH